MSLGEMTNDQANRTGTASNACSCDHYATERRDLIKPTFNRELADYWASVSPSACEVYGAMLDELYVHHHGSLHGFERTQLDLLAYDENGDDFIDRAIGSGYRNVRRYLARATVNRVNRLSKEHHDLALLLQHARAIRNCRTVGLCAHRMLTSD